MSRDLIYRDEAIKALGEEPPVWNDEYHEIAEREQWRSDVKAIEAVPSAQPEKMQLSREDATFDCISRQAVIDMIMGQPPEAHYPSWYAEQIKALPSAQPEPASCKQVTGKLDLINRQDAIDAIVKCTNCNTPEDLKEYVAEHSLWSQWSGGVLEALEAVEALPSAPLYTPDELQTMQDLEWAQLEKMYELGKAERKKGKWIPHEGGKFVGFPCMHYECSECRAFEPTETNFCPNCGAYMREGEHHDD